MSECNSIEETYQNNKDVILNRAKDYYKNDKERFREQARYKYNLSQKKKKKMKSENMEETDIIICLKKKRKD